MRVEQGQMTYKDMGYNKNLSRMLKQPSNIVYRGDVASGDLEGLYPRPSVVWENGIVIYDTYYVPSATTPISAGDTGTAGQVAYDSGYIYVCVSANTWKRAALSTWV
jgi:hypothetical protein